MIFEVLFDLNGSDQKRYGFEVACLALVRKYATLVLVFRVRPLV